MAIIPSPIEDPQSWDEVMIGGKRLPGVAVPTNVDSPRDYDVKKAKGKAKAKVTNNGDPPRKPKIAWQFDPAESWNEANQIITEIIEPRKAGKKLDPVEVVHPLFARHGIRTCLIVNYDGPNFDKGKASITIDLLEYEAPKPAAGIGSGRKGGGGGGGQDARAAELQHALNAIEAQERELQSLEQSLAGNDPDLAKRIADQRRQLRAQKQTVMAELDKPSHRGPAQNV